MNRYQRTALTIAAINLLLVLLFPPFDQYSIAVAGLPVFAGFHFVFLPLPYSQVNDGVLLLEVFVVLINTGIALLLLRDKPLHVERRRFTLRGAVLIITGVNLVLILLFPPFESAFALSKATLPSFEGFYFIFSQQRTHVIVTTLLYLEAAFVLVNGALFWLIFKPRNASGLAV